MVERDLLYAYQGLKDTTKDEEPVDKAWNQFFRYCQLSVIARHPEDEIVTGFKLVIFSGNRLALRKNRFRFCVPGPCCDCACTEGKTARQKKMKKPAKHRRYFLAQ